MTPVYLFTTIFWTASLTTPYAVSGLGADLDVAHDDDDLQSVVVYIDVARVVSLDQSSHDIRDASYDDECNVMSMSTCSKP